MEILHLTDLHVTRPNTSLANLWSTAVPCLEKRKSRFQFIVVSGDLTQQAGEEEFTELLGFSARLMEWLEEKDPRRIIFVPGNHDVEWSDRFWTEVREGDCTPNDLKGFLREPEKADLRARIHGEGVRLQIRRIRDRARYQERFTHASAFFQSFYGATAPPDRNFELLSTDPREHWSAHVFTREKVAFYGFSSCFSNDQYWRGATLDEDAVRSAAEHARTHARGMLWIAVWHHGLFSGRGDPDHLQPRELGYLRFNGFHLGLHGHTHVDDFGDLRDVLGDAFPVVATGSFGVGPAERPDTRNQFAVLDLSPNYLHIERFELGRMAEWTSTRQPPYRLTRRAGNPTPFNEARVHHRTVQIDPSSGRTDFAIAFEELALHRELTMAEPVGPYSNIVFDEHAEADGAALPIRETPVAADRRRLSLAGTGQTYGRLAWGFILSNVLTRDRAALDMRKWNAFGQRLRAAPDWRERDWISHVVSMHCRELVLEIRLHPDVPGRLFEGGVAMRVFDRQNDVEDPEEAGRCSVDAAPDGRSVMARVERPVLGHSYVLGYRPDLPGVTYARNATLALVQNVADLARRGTQDPSLRQALTEAVEKRIRIALRIDPGQRLLWYGYLWDHRSRSLQTAFGRCPFHAAAVTFEYGRGVPGHAFRTCQPASYFSSEGRRSLICLPEESTEHEWIVQVPILLDESGPAVGVVGFAGRGDQGGADRELRGFAQRMALRADRPAGWQAEEEAALTRIASRLLLAVTAAFWDGLPEQIRGRLPEADEEEARRVYHHWSQLVQARPA